MSVRYDNREVAPIEILLVEETLENCDTSVNDNTLLDMEVSNVLKVSIASPVIDDIFLTPEMFER